MFREQGLREFDRAVAEFSDHPIKTQASLIAAFLGSLQRFFATLGKPVLTRKRKLSPLEPPTSKKYNATLVEMKSDIDTAYVQQTAIEESVVANFNYFQTEKIRLRNALKDARSKAEDFSIFSRAVDSPEMWFKDSFNNLSLVDLIVGTVLPRSHVDTDSGTATLPKVTESRAWASADDFSAVTVQHNLPESDPEEYRLGAPITRLVPDSIEGRDHYQGKMYGLVTLEGSSTGEDGLRIDDSDVFSDVTPLLKTVDFEGSIDSPTTIWEYEIVALEAERVDWSEKATDEESRRQRRAMTPIRNDMVEAIIVKDPGLEITPGTRAEGYAWNQNGKINARTAYPLDIAITYAFKNPVRINSISVTPYTFGKRAYPIIVDIATASELDPVKDTERAAAQPGVIVRPAGLTSLPQFQGSSQYRLDTNSISRSSSSEVSLSKPYRFDFPARNVKFVVITMRQDTPYPMKYTLGLASRNWTIKETKDGGWFHRDKEKRYTTSKFVWVDFLGKGFMKEVAVQTRSRLSDERLTLNLENRGSSDLERSGGVLVSAGIGFLIGNFIVPIIGGVIGALIGAIAGLLGDAWNTIFGGRITKEVEKEEDVFPDARFNGTGLYDVQSTQSNRWRYAIGIQDISMGISTYAESGELPSINFVCPLPIHKIALEADETIPDIFRTIDPKKRWIEYFVSIDNGATFYRINPVTAPEVTFPDDPLTYIPKIIHVNSDIEPNRRKAFAGGERAFIDLTTPAYRVRLKVVFRRPQSTEGIAGASDPQFYTPQLNKYGIRVLPKAIGGRL